MVYNSFLFIWLFPIIFMVGNNLIVPTVNNKLADYAFFL